MKKYQIVFIFIILLFFLFNLYFELMDSKKIKNIRLKDFNKSVIDLRQFLYVSESKIYPNNFNLWDMKQSKILKTKEENKLKKDKEKNKKKKQNLKIKYREICVEKQCWQLTGVMTINNIKKLLLLRKGKKTKLETFMIGEELLPKIFIIDINEDSMILLNKEKNKKIILKLFDVNLSKYRPKVTKDKND